MNRDVEITIKGLAQDGGDDVSSVSSGNYFFKNNTHFIIFEDVQDDGEKCQNRIKLWEDKVELVRTGALRTSMVFEAGKKNPVEYFTPYGHMRFMIQTKKLYVEMKEEEFKVDISYILGNADDSEGEDGGRVEDDLSKPRCDFLETSDIQGEHCMVTIRIKSK